MKRGQCGTVLSEEELSPHDRAEVDRFKSYLRLVGEKVATGMDRRKAQYAAHAEIYGEVVFDSEPR